MTKVQMRREDVINEMVSVKLDFIAEDDACLEEILKNGHIGYNQQSNIDLEKDYNDQTGEEVEVVNEFSNDDGTCTICRKSFKEEELKLGGVNLRTKKLDYFCDECY